MILRSTEFSEFTENLNKKNSNRFSFLSLSWTTVNISAQRIDAYCSQYSMNKP